MTRVSDDHIRQLLGRFSEIQARMASGTVDGDDFVKLSKEYAELEPVAKAAQHVHDMRGELVGLAEMAADPEMKELAAEEKARIDAELPDAELALAISLLPRDSADERSAMLEIRAGTGGDEAALFAGDLFRMYSRYADLRGWKLEQISANSSEQGGYKEVVASVSGAGVFARLKFESGVHRVQRVPATESGGRIHTSAATVAVLPQPEEVDVHIDERDLEIDVYRASGAGGQHVNTTDSAVRITHVPTGVVVTCQDGRSQHKNKEKAMQVLRARLYEAERQRIADIESTARKSMVGSGDRSERIRTYNYPQGRVTDHRINLTLHKLPEIVAGDGLDDVISALISEDQADRLAGMEA